MSVEVSFETGAVGPMHCHPHEQLTYVLSGVFSFTIGDETQTVRRGIRYINVPGLCTAVSALNPECCWICLRQSVRIFYRSGVLSFIPVFILFGRVSFPRPFYLTSGVVPFLSIILGGQSGYQNYCQAYFFEQIPLSQ